MQLTNHTVGNCDSSHRDGHGGVYEDVMGLCCIQISIQLVVVTLKVTTHISTLPEEPSFHFYNIALKCKMQVASLAEPKTPLESSMFIIGFFVHTMKHCYATALYSKHYPLHMRV